LKTILKFVTIGVRSFEEAVVILCVCRGVSDREVVEAVRCGARSLDDVTRRCRGAGNACGTCRPLIAKCIAVAGSQPPVMLGPVAATDHAVRPAA
jgi:bacterioferritin-associated ferredoxin